MIVRVAQVARTVIGENGAVGRLGGDELAALLTGRTLEETLALAERLRDAVEQLSFDDEGDGLRVTASIGVAAIDPRDPDAEAVLRRADQSLYAAKSAGRNRVRAAAA